MRRKLIQFLLLLSLSFNIAHASFIASEDHCDHESVSEYVLEQSASQDCHDICDLTHMFNLTAIISLSLPYIEKPLHTEEPQSTLLSYHPPFKETENKPPIA